MQKRAGKLLRRLAAVERLELAEAAYAGCRQTKTKRGLHARTRRDCRDDRTLPGRVLALVFQRAAGRKESLSEEAARRGHRSPGRHPAEPQGLRLKAAS